MAAAVASGVVGAAGMIYLNRGYKVSGAAPALVSETSIFDIDSVMYV